MKTASVRRPDSVSLTAPAIRRLEGGGAITLARAPEGYDAFVVAELTRASDAMKAKLSARGHALD